MMNVMQAIRRAVRPAAVAAAFVVLCSAAQGQPHKPSAAALADARQLVQLTGANHLFKPLVAGVVEQAKLLYLQQNPSLQKDLNAVASDLRAKLSPRISEVTDEVARLYAAQFTEKELKQVLAFYQSPVGQKLLVQQPQIISTSMKFAQSWANKLSDQVIAQMREEMKKRGHPM